MQFDDCVRNQLKDFIGSKNWSVSRFASRYIELYGEIFSKMEAPRQSTARKLIEDKKHIYSENEARVLEKMTGLPIVQWWLEEQHRILLAKSAEHANTSDSMDGEAIVKWEIRRHSEHQSPLKAEDVVCVLKRYLEAETLMPLIILSDSPMEVRTLLADCMPEIQRISVSELSTEGRDMPFDAFYCFVPEFVADSEAGKAFRVALEIMRHDRELGRPRHVILLYQIFGKEELEQAILNWGKAALVFPVNLPEDEFKKEDDEALFDWREKCLERMRTLPDLFKEEIRAIPNFPKFATASECADFIMPLYEQQRSYFQEDNEMYMALYCYLTFGLPEAWLDADYDRKSMLIGLWEFTQWKDAKETELSEAGVDPETDEFHLAAMQKLNRIVWAVFHKSDSLSCDATMWRQVFESTYNSLLMEE